MTTGKAMFLGALLAVLVLGRGHVTIRLSPVGNFAVVDFFDRNVIDFASGAAAIDETPSEPEPSAAVIASTIEL
jgi:hypothetical protein